MGAGSFYRGQTAEAEVAGLRERGYPVEYIDRTLSEAELAGLYAACDCLVHPFRGEGFGLPVVEAMACGLPVIVTGAGPVLDYATDETAFLIPARRGQFAECRVGELETIEPALAVRAGRRCAGRAAEARGRRPRQRHEPRGWRPASTSGAVSRGSGPWMRSEGRLLALAAEKPDQPRMNTDAHGWDSRRSAEEAARGRFGIAWQNQVAQSLLPPGSAISLSVSIRVHPWLKISPSRGPGRA